MGEETTNIVNCTDYRFDYLKMYVNKWIMIGSYSCDNYFLKLMKYIDDLHIVFEMYDLVIPILSESSIGILNDDLFKRIAKNARQIVVNDYGVLKALSKEQYSLRLGRLLFYQYRDSRYDEVESRNLELEYDSFSKYMYGQECEFDAIEIDLASKHMVITGDMTVYVHYPYRLLSITRICEFCGQKENGYYRFSPELQCSFQCLDVFLKIKNTGCVKRGKSIYEKLTDEYEVVCDSKRYILMEELA